MPRFDVTIAGELNLDLILYGLPEELPSERELLADNLMLTLGSSSAIVAHNLAALGVKVGFASCVGDDPLGHIAVERLRNVGVDVSKVRMSGTTKTGLTVILQHPNGRKILTYPGSIFALTFDDLDLSYLADARHFHLSSFYLQRGLRARVPELLQKLKSAGLTVSLDPNDDPEDRWAGELKEALRYVDVLLPNAREAQQIAGTNDLQSAIDTLAQMVPVVAAKRGAEGAIARKGDQPFVSPAVQVTAMDAVGAGDSFDAGFISQYILGADLAACLEYGNLAGAFSTTRPGGTEAFGDRLYQQEFFRAHFQR
jgi:sugar/nucleoside kinase (ribokinase family)